MHFIFLTRCFTPNTIQIIKDNIKSVFDNQVNDTHHTYEQRLIVDMSHGQNPDIFTPFADEHTIIHFIPNKKDYYMYEDCDDLLATIHQDNTYVYFLDDDNILAPNFLGLCDEFTDEDIVIFKLENHDGWGNEGCGVCTVDIGNYISKLSILQKYKIGTCEDSRCCDGHFVEVLRANNCSFKYVNKVYGFYNKLKEM